MTRFLLAAILATMMVALAAPAAHALDAPAPNEYQRTNAITCPEAQRAAYTHFRHGLYGHCWQVDKDTMWVYATSYAFSVDKWCREGTFFLGRCWGGAYWYRIIRRR